MTRSKGLLLRESLTAKLVPDVRREDWPALFFLALFAGAFVLLAIIAVFLPGGITEQEETEIFVLGWLLGVAGAYLAVPVFVWISHKYMRGVPNALLTLLTVNSLTFALWTSAMNLSWQRSESKTLAFSLAYAGLLVVPAVNLISAILIHKSRKAAPAGVGWALSSVGTLGFLNFAGFIPYFQRAYSTPISLLGLSALVGLAVLVIRRPRIEFTRKRLLLIGVDLVMISAVVLASYDSAFQVNPLHQNFYLGPVNRVLHGGTMLVDSFSQYGVGVIYFLTSVFRTGIIPFTYQGFSLLTAILLMLQFSGLYLVMRSTLQDRPLALLVLILSMLLGVYGTLGAIQSYPSAGPLRFGLAYLMLISVYLRHRFSRLHRAGLVVEYSLVSLTSLWSFETFVYTAFPYLGVCLLESIAEGGLSKASARPLLRRLSLLVACLVAANGLFALLTYARAGAWPDWPVYLDFIRTYSSRGFGDLPIDPWSPWLLVVAVLFASLMGFVFRVAFLDGPDRSPGGMFVFGLTLLGIAEFTYYLGRSHPNNLYHISTPAVLVCGYWYSKIRSCRDLPAILRRAVQFSYTTSATLIVLALLPSFMTKYHQDDTGFYLVKKTVTWALTGRDPVEVWAAERAKLYRGSGNPQVSDAVDALTRLSPRRADANVFIDPVAATEVLIRANRIQQLPISEVTEDSLSQRLMSRIQNYPWGSMGNEIVLVPKDPSAYRDVIYNSLQIQIVWHLCQEFGFDVVEDTPSGILVIRLDPAAGRQSSYCKVIESLHNESLAWQAELFR